MKEPNGEADFSTSMTTYGGVFGAEVTQDADRHIVGRKIIWTYQNECAET